MQRTLTLTLLHLVAAAILFLFGWGSVLLLQHPYAGMTWSLSNGEVHSVDPTGPAAGLVQPGDVLKSADNTPIEQVRYLADWEIGDEVRFQVEREGLAQPVSIHLEQTPRNHLLLRLIPMLVGLAFWGVGFFTLSYSSSDKQSVLFFLFSQGFSIALITGELSSVAPLWAAHLFNLSLWLVGPLSIHFHLHFPQDNQFRRRRAALTLLYGVALIGSLPDLVSNPLTLRANLPILYILRLFWLISTLVIATILLIMHYRRAQTAIIREQIQIVSLGGVLAFLPPILLLLLPNILLGRPLIPYAYNFLFLILIPLGYAYAIARYRLINLNRYLQRVAIYTVMAVVLAVVGLWAYSSVMRALSLTMEEDYVVGSGLALICVGAAFTVFNLLRKPIEQRFYGGWYDYRSAVRQIGQQFDLSMDIRTIGRVFTQQIREVLLFDMSGLVLVDRNDDVYVIEPEGQENAALMAPLPNSKSPVIRYLFQLKRPLAAQKLRDRFTEVDLADDDARLVAFPDAQWWLPLYGQDNLVGILVIGAKRGGEAFTDHDLDILDALNRQVSAVLHNALLIEQLRQQANEMRQLTQQIMRVREEERKTLSRGLHDHTIQALIGLNYQFAHQHDQLLSQPDATILEFQDEIRSVISDLRQVCSDLRPPQLDNLGLASAVRTLVRKMKSQKNYEIALRIEGDEMLDIPEESAVCIYYVLQEALNNVQKHANANRVTVNLAMASDKVSLVVEDDGRGFELPSDLGLLVHEKHFGLIGLRERVEQAGGLLKIDSRPGDGTRLEAGIQFLDQSTPK